MQDDYYSQISTTEKPLKKKKKLRLIPKEVLEKREKEKLDKNNSVLSKTIQSISPIQKKRYQIYNRTRNELNVLRKEVNGKGKKKGLEEKKRLKKIKKEKDPYKILQFYFDDIIELRELVGMIGNSGLIMATLGNFIKGHPRIGRKIYEKIFALDEYGILFLSETGYRKALNFGFEEYNLKKIPKKEIYSLPKRKGKSNKYRSLQNRAHWYR